jgi:hypothetical protein
MTNKKEEEKEVSAWDKLELSAKITIIFFAFFIGFPLSIGLIIFIIQTVINYFDKKARKKEIKDKMKTKTNLLCAKIKKFKTVIAIPILKERKPCYCYFDRYNNILGCTDKNNEIHYPDENITSAKIHPHSNKIHSDPHTNSHSHTLPHTNPHPNLHTNPHPN